MMLGKIIDVFPKYKVFSETIIICYSMYAFSANFGSTFKYHAVPKIYNNM